MAMKKITPCLLFGGNAEAATKFYLSVFKDSKLIDTKRRGKQVIFTIFRSTAEVHCAQWPKFKFTPATSFFVRARRRKK